jgi:hypothetical protein
MLLMLAGAILASSTMAAQAAEAGPMGALAVSVGRILAGTPWFVYPLLALLVYFGLQGRRTRRVRLTRLALLPIGFFIWGCLGVAGKASVQPVLGAVWLVLAGLGLALALVSRRVDPARIDRETLTVERPGSWQPLIRNLVIFTVKYALAVAWAVLPAARASLAFWDIGFSGAMAGYFLGGLIALYLAYRRAGNPPLRLETSSEAGS